jgi:hypothetical protein
MGAVGLTTLFSASNRPKDTRRHIAWLCFDVSYCPWKTVLLSILLSATIAFPLLTVGLATLFCVSTVPKGI